MLASPAYASAAAEGAEHSGPLFSIFGLDVSSSTTSLWGIIVVLALVAYFASRKLERIPTRRLQIAMELALESILSFLTGVMGSEKKARQYFPVLASLFIIILFSNYSGLIPGFGHTPGLKAPTSTLSVTAGLAIVVFFATHYYGVKAHGIKYFKHFIQPIPFLLPINIIEEFVRPLSLSLRLYGNVYGEEMVIAGLFALLPLFLPLPMMFLGLLFGFIQALVFTMLASIYISTASAEHH